MTSGDASDVVPAGPVPSSAAGERLLDLVRVMARLRGPDGCPWDREQTHATLARHLLEETHETLEAIDAGDPERLRDELGDVLLQIVFHAQMAAEAGDFDVDAVAEGGGTDAAFAALQTRSGRAAAAASRARRSSSSKWRGSRKK